MAGKSIPMPDEYIVWRDNQGRYHVAERPPDLRPPLPSRTRAVQWLWGEFGRVFADRGPSSGRHPTKPAVSPNVWHTHFGEVTETSEEEDTHDSAERNQPVH